MKVHNQSGSRERLKEMFERVNKLKLNETFDVPVVDDKKYLDKTGDEPAGKEQPNKYDGGVDYPAIDDLKTDHESLDKIAEEENLDELSLGGLSQAGKYASDKIGGAVKDKFNQAKTAVKGKYDQAKSAVDKEVSGVKRQYQAGAGNAQLNKIQKYAQDFGEKFGKYLAKYNERAEKAGLEPISPLQIGNSIVNSINNEFKKGGDTRNVDLSKYKLKEDEEEEYQEIEGGLADQGTVDQIDNIEDLANDKADPNEFLPNQIIKGMEVEMEHTNDPRQALEIAMDHLVEIPDYYDHLDDMEDEATAGDAEQEDGRDDSADTLLDPSQHWVDDYTPKKLGDETSIDENNYDVSPQLEKWLDFHQMSADEYRRLPYQEKLNLINQYQKAQPTQDVSQDPYGGDPEGVANWLEKDKAAGRSPMDEDMSNTFEFIQDGKGNFVPKGAEDQGVGIRQVEQPMGSGNVKYLAVILNSEGGVEEVIDTKDSFEEASAVVSSQF